MKKLVLLSALLLLSRVPLSEAANSVSVVIDTARTVGNIRDLQGVNVPPVFDSKTPGTSYTAENLYTAFGISQVRLHDSGLDLCSIYKAATRQNLSVSPPVTVTTCTVTPNGGITHYKWTPTSTADADLNNPDNYDFTEADEAIRKTLASGAKVYLGLAQRYNGPNDTNDAVAWAKVATNIYKHVIGVFKPSSGIAVDPAYVEIHNEPDGGFWQGDSATFISLYKEINSRVRAAAAAAGKSVKAGGAGFTKNVLTKSQQSDSTANGFLANVGVSAQDFFSAHLYDRCANATMQSSASFLRNLRSLVDSQGGAALPLHITEWNIGLGNDCGNSYFAEQRNQSFASGVLTLMQDPSLNVQAAHYYAGVTVMSLFDFTAAAGVARINPASWALWAHAKLQGASMLDAQVCQSSTCAAGYTTDALPLLVLAAKANGGQEIVITNDSSADVSYDLKLNGLSATSVDVTVIVPPTGTKDLPVSGSPQGVASKDVTSLMNSLGRTTQKSQTVSGGSLTLSITIPARSLQMLEVRSAGTTVTTPAQSECVFRWAERTYPQYFTPVPAASVTAAPYFYRYYAGSKNYLATATDNQVYVLGPVSGNKVLKVGSVESFLATAGCSQ